MSQVSYIQDRHVVTQKEADYLHRLFNGLPEQDQNFGCHVFLSNRWQHQEHPDGSPVPYRAWKKAYPQANPFRLQEFISISSRRIDHCREYKVREPYLSEFLAVTSTMTAEELLNEPRIYFETSRRVTRARKSRLSDDNNYPLPVVIQKAIRVLSRNGCYVNVAEVIDHVQQLYCACQEAETQCGTGSEEYRRAKSRYVNDNSCYRSVWETRPHRYQGDLFRFDPVLSAKSTGRLFVKGGGLQTASGEMKRRAYSGLTGFRNYDIKSSQVSILIKLLEKARIDPSWLIQYVNTDNYKEVYGRKAGIPGDLMKRIVISMCMGAHLPATLRNYVRKEDRKRGGSYRKNSILDYLSEEAKDLNQLQVLLSGVREVLQPLSVTLKKFHTYLSAEYIPGNKVNGRGGPYLRNAAGMHLRLSDFNPGKSKGNKRLGPAVAAHLLQGLEAAVTLEMIGRSDEANFTPISCEHDGFIVSAGEADMTMWEEITRRHGLEGMQLVVKDL